MPIPRKNSSCFPMAAKQSVVPKWPSRECLLDVPRAVANIQSWPAWRRLLLLPDTQALERIDAWRGLVQALALIDPKAINAPFDRSRDGIFGESRSCWNQFTEPVWEKSEFEGLANGQEGNQEVVLKNPFGPLVMTVSIADFACDISDIEGIENSAFSTYFYESVATFGQKHCRSARVEISKCGLVEMLSHHDIRIINRPGVDSLNIWFWDGRLFLRNSDEACHFAGAAFIAEVIQESVRLQAPIELRWLNEPAWNWLLSRYSVLYQPDQDYFLPRQCLAILLDQVFATELGHRCVRQDIVFMIPKKAVAFPSVIRLLEQHGFQEINREIHRLLRRQEENRRKLSRRWPVICTPPWLVKSYPEQVA